MAFTADIDPNDIAFFSCSCLKRLTASANNVNFSIFWMNSALHGFTPPFQLSYLMYYIDIFFICQQNIDIFLIVDDLIKLLAKISNLYYTQCRITKYILEESMNAWSLSKPRELQNISTESQKVEKGFCKVRITYVGITRNDFDIFSGKYPVNYPIVMGRSAIGVVVDVDEQESIKKGDRVVLSPYLPCFNCIKCREGKPDECLDMSYAGVDVNGFLTDFFVLPICNVYALPDVVDDKEAVFIPYLALALTILDKIDYDKGTYIGVGSGGVLGNVLSQLCIYYQTVPILFDHVQSHLDAAKDMGVYYTFLSDENTSKKVLQVTSGKMIDSLVYIRQDAMPIIDSFKYLKNAGELVISSIATIDASVVNVPLKHILDHEIKVLPVPYKNDNFETAINLIVNDSINVLQLISGVTPITDINSFLNSDVEADGKAFFMQLIKVL